MKRKSILALGPGAPSLILIFVVLALSMLGMLALFNGRNDVRLSERSVQVMEDVYALYTGAEQTRAQLDAVLAGAAMESSDEEEYFKNIEQMLPDYAQLSGSEIRWTETDGIRNLHCGLRVLPLGSGEREMWVQHTLVSAAAEEEEMFDEW